MRLLKRSLPRMSLRPGIDASEFFDRCEAVVSGSRTRIDRRREFSGPGFDQLNLWLREEPDELVLRMVATPDKSLFVECDVIARWDGAPSFDQYVTVAKAAFKSFLRQYSKAYSHFLRLGIERKPAAWDWKENTVSCNRIRYAHDKFHEAVRALAVGAEDSRGRLRSAHLILHVIRADDLPEPLRPHLDWIFSRLSSRPPRWQGEGTVDATLAAMTRATGARIAERIVLICEALDELCPENRL